MNELCKSDIGVCSMFGDRVVLTNQQALSYGGKTLCTESKSRQDAVCHNDILALIYQCLYMSTQITNFT